MQQHDARHYARCQGEWRLQQPRGISPVDSLHAPCRQVLGCVAMQGSASQAPSTRQPDADLAPRAEEDLEGYRSAPLVFYGCSNKTISCKLKNQLQCPCKRAVSGAGVRLQLRGPSNRWCPMRSWCEGQLKPFRSSGGIQVRSKNRQFSLVSMCKNRLSSWDLTSMRTCSLASQCRIPCGMWHVSSCPCQAVDACSERIGQLAAAQKNMAEAKAQGAAAAELAWKPGESLQDFRLVCTNHAGTTCNPMLPAMPYTAYISIISLLAVREFSRWLLLRRLADRRWVRMSLGKRQHLTRGAMQGTSTTVWQLLSPCLPLQEAVW